jgi:(+)-trans-carveol dehydrogenase
VRDFESLEQAVGSGVQEFGRLDIVVANAGITSYGATAELAEAEWRLVIDVNLTGTWLTCKATIPHLRKAGGGAIIITSSTAGLKGPPGMAHYVASKHGQVGLMRTLANELASDMIRVNTVNPTGVDTPMIDNDAARELFRGSDGETPTRAMQEAISRSMNALPIPWVEARDVSNAVLFLASDEGRYITGVALPVDAGSLVK